MAAISKTLTQDRERRSSSATRRANMSHGRGGAGNIGSTPSDFEPPTLDTPTLKGNVYTTGRGGSGNMAKNNDPEAARRAQDVVATPRRESGNNTHVGRGGAANVFKPSAEDVAKAKADRGRWESAVGDEGGSVDGERERETRGRKESEKGFAEKGKDWLFGKKH